MARQPTVQATDSDEFGEGCKQRAGALSRRDVVEYDHSHRDCRIAGAEDAADMKHDSEQCAHYTFNTGDIAMGTKAAYQDKIQSELREWQAKIEALKAKADQAEAQQKIKYYQQLDSLNTKQQQVQAKLDELRSASEGAWEETKAGVDSA